MGHDSTIWDDEGLFFSLIIAGAGCGALIVLALWLVGFPPSMVVARILRPNHITTDELSGKMVMAKARAYEEGQRQLQGLDSLEEEEKQRRAIKATSTTTPDASESPANNATNEVGLYIPTPAGSSLEAPLNGGNASSAVNINDGSTSNGHDDDEDAKAAARKNTTVKASLFTFPPIRRLLRLGELGYAGEEEGPIATGPRIEDGSKSSAEKKNSSNPTNKNAPTSQTTTAAPPLPQYDLEDNLLTRDYVTVGTATSYTNSPAATNLNLGGGGGANDKKVTTKQTTSFAGLARSVDGAAMLPQDPKVDVLLFILKLAMVLLLFGTFLSTVWIAVVSGTDNYLDVYYDEIDNFDCKEIRNDTGCGNNIHCKWHATGERNRTTSTATTSTTTTVAPTTTATTTEVATTTAVPPLMVDYNGGGSGAQLWLSLADDGNVSYDGYCHAVVVPGLYDLSIQNIHPDGDTWRWYAVGGMASLFAIIFGLVLFIAVANAEQYVLRVMRLQSRHALGYRTVLLKGVPEGIAHDEELFKKTFLSVEGLATPASLLSFFGKLRKHVTTPIVEKVAGVTSSSNNNTNNATVDASSTNLDDFTVTMQRPILNGLVSVAVEVPANDLRLFYKGTRVEEITAGATNTTNTTAAASSAVVVGGARATSPSSPNSTSPLTNANANKMAAAEEKKRLAKEAKARKASEKRQAKKEQQQQVANRKGAAINISSAASNNGGEPMVYDNNGSIIGGLPQSETELGSGGMRTPKNSIFGGGMDTSILYSRTTNAYADTTPPSSNAQSAHGRPSVLDSPERPIASATASAPNLNRATLAPGDNTNQQQRSRGASGITTDDLFVSPSSSDTDDDGDEEASPMSSASASAAVTMPATATTSAVAAQTSSASSFLEGFADMSDAYQIINALPTVRILSSAVTTVPCKQISLTAEVAHTNYQKALVALQDAVGEEHRYHHELREAREKKVAELRAKRKKRGADKKKGDSGNAKDNAAEQPPSTLPSTQAYESNRNVGDDVDPHHNDTNSHNHHHNDAASDVLSPFARGASPNAPTAAASPDPAYQSNADRHKQADMSAASPLAPRREEGGHDDDDDDGVNANLEAHHGDTSEFFTDSMHMATNNGNGNAAVSKTTSSIENKQSTRRFFGGEGNGKADDSSSATTNRRASTFSATKVYGNSRHDDDEPQPTHPNGNTSSFTAAAVVDMTPAEQAEEAAILGAPMPPLMTTSALCKKVPLVEERTRQLKKAAAVLSQSLEKLKVSDKYNGAVYVVFEDAACALEYCEVVRARFSSGVTTGSSSSLSGVSLTPITADIAGPPSEINRGALNINTFAARTFFVLCMFLFVWLVFFYSIPIAALGSLDGLARLPGGVGEWLDDHIISHMSTTVRGTVQAYLPVVVLAVFNILLPIFVRMMVVSSGSPNREDTDKWQSLLMFLFSFLTSVVFQAVLQGGLTQLGAIIEDPQWKVISAMLVAMVSPSGGYWYALVIGSFIGLWVMALNVGTLLRAVFLSPTAASQHEYDDLFARSTPSTQLLFSNALVMVGIGILFHATVPVLSFACGIFFMFAYVVGRGIYLDIYTSPINNTTQRVSHFSMLRYGLRCLSVLYCFAVVGLILAFTVKQVWWPTIIVGCVCVPIAAFTVCRVYYKSAGWRPSVAVFRYWAEEDEWAGVSTVVYGASVRRGNKRVLSGNGLASGAIVSDSTAYDPHVFSLSNNSDHTNMVPMMLAGSGSGSGHSGGGGAFMLDGPNTTKPNNRQTMPPPPLREGSNGGDDDDSDGAAASILIGSGVHERNDYGDETNPKLQAQLAKERATAARERRMFMEKDTLTGDQTMYFGGKDDESRSFSPAAGGGDDDEDEEGPATVIIGGDADGGMTNADDAGLDFYLRNQRRQQQKKTQIDKFDGAESVCYSVHGAESMSIAGSSVSPSNYYRGGVAAGQHQMSGGGGADGVGSAARGNRANNRHANTKANAAAASSPYTAFFLYHHRGPIPMALYPDVMKKRAANAINSTADATTSGTNDRETAAAEYYNSTAAAFTSSYWGHAFMAFDDKPWDYQSNHERMLLNAAMLAAAASPRKYKRSDSCPSTITAMSYQQHLLDKSHTNIVRHTPSAVGGGGFSGATAADGAYAPYGDDLDDHEKKEKDEDANSSSDEDNDNDDRITAKYGDCTTYVNADAEIAAAKASNYSIARYWHGDVLEDPYNVYDEDFDDLYGEGSRSPAQADILVLDGEAMERYDAGRGVAAGDSGGSRYYMPTQSGLSVGSRSAVFTANFASSMAGGGGVATIGDDTNTFGYRNNSASVRSPTSPAASYANASINNGGKRILRHNGGTDGNFTPSMSLADFNRTTTSVGGVGGGRRAGSNLDLGNNSMAYQQHPQLLQPSPSGALGEPSAQQRQQYLSLNQSMRGGGGARSTLTPPSPSLSAPSKSPVIGPVRRKK